MKIALDVHTAVGALTISVQSADMLTHKQLSELRSDHPAHTEIRTVLRAAGIEIARIADELPAPVVW